jgi:hypothetical protein
MAAACPAALAAAADAGLATSRAAAPPTKRRRIASATSNSPRAKARVRAMASPGRLSPGASASNNHSTRCAQSAAHPATIRLSASLSVCGEPTASDSPRHSEPAPGLPLGRLLLVEVAHPRAGRGRSSPASHSGSCFRVDARLRASRAPSGSGARGVSGVVGDLWLLAIFASRALDECYDPACHEPGGAHGLTRCVSPRQPRRSRDPS